MLIRLLAGSGIGVGLGALLGYFGSCSTGTCPLTATPWRGAFFGLLLGVAFAFSFSPSRDYASAVAAEKIAPIKGAESFRTQVLKSDSPVFVKFHAPWCSWCRRLEPTVEKLASEFKGRMKFVKINTDEHKDLAARYGIRGLPTSIIFSKGKPAETIAGYRKLEPLRAIVEKHAAPASAPAKPQPAKVAAIHEITGAPDFKTRVREAKEHVLVKFEADWCGWCHRLTPEVKKIAAHYDGRLKVVAVDTDKHPGLAREFGVRGLPTMHLFKGGKSVKAIVGYRDESALTEVLDPLLPATTKSKPKPKPAVKKPAPAAPAGKIRELAKGSDFEKQVTGAKGLVLVKFHADWCGWCRKLTPVVEKLAGSYSGKLTVVGVNVDKLRELATANKVRGLPTMLLFKDGKQVERIAGYREETELKTLLDKHIGKAR